MRLFGKIFVLLFSYQLVMAQESMPAEPVICHYTEQDSFTEILPDKALLSNNRLSNGAAIEVTYIDFPEGAKAAYQQAITIWQKYLFSTQTIRIKATWVSLSAGVLSVTGATRIYKNFSNAPYSDLWYPVALAEAIAAKDLNNGDYEIEMKVNSNINWYLGTDGRAQSGKYDLTTVILHEVAHGLGFSSSMKLVNNNTQGQYGQSGNAYIYDTFLQNSSKIKLTDATIFGNPSTSLKDILTGNALFFGLKDPKFASTLPKLYAPTTYSEGSSISHFDESTYPQGNPNSLMSPNVRSAEVNQNPGELLLNCLKDLGWQIIGMEGAITGTENVQEQALDVLVFPNPVVDIVNVAFPLTNQPRNISIELINTTGKCLQIIEKQAVIVETIPLDLQYLNEGVYLLKIKDGNKIITKKLVK